jgi:hypothetical protein
MAWSEVRGSDWNELVTELDARWDFMNAFGHSPCRMKRSDS